jgi:cytoskeletal protein CcmA (bactofilin family)
MLQVKRKLQEERESTAAVKSIAPPLAGNDPVNSIGLSAQISASTRPTPPRKANRLNFTTPRVADGRSKQTRIPGIIGEATFRGMIAVDGNVSGQPGANGGGALTIRQHGRSSVSGPELNGEIRFIEMIRVNRHIAGTVYSELGTFIVDSAAVIDADVEVGIAVIGGTVNGDVVAHQRVELGPTAKIYGNIWTRSLAIQNGAIFEGVCRMLENTENGN